MDGTINARNSSTRYLRIINIFAFIAMVAVNILAEVLPINGVTSGQVSDSYASLFTPAGITFSIWGVIYIGMAYFAFWQAFTKNDDIVDRIGISFAISCALNIAWLILWHYNMVYLATVVIFVLLFTIGDIRKTVWSSDEISTCNEDSCSLDSGSKGKANWAIKAGFSIYNAWILMASIASAFIIAGDLFSGFAFSVLAQVLVCMALLAAAIMAFARVRLSGDIAWALTTAWTVAGIIIKHMAETGIGFSGEFKAVLITACASLAAAVLSILLIRKKGMEMI